MTLLDALGRLVQLGGIGGSLAFLYLGYKLLRTELNRLTPSGYASAVRDRATETIRYFVRVSLIFFICGVASELLLSGKVMMMIQILHDQITRNLTRARLVSWGFDPSTKVIVFKLASVRFDQEAFLPNSTLNQYKIVVGVRADSSVPDDAGSYPIFFGEYNFPIADQSEVHEPLTPEKSALISGKCVKMVVFGLSLNAKLPKPNGEFRPGDFGRDIKVFSWQMGGPDGLGC